VARAGEMGTRTVGGHRRLGVLRPAVVIAGSDGRPQRVDGRVVDTVRESWLIEDRWWTQEPLRRRYWEIVTLDGRNQVVFRDVFSGRWWRQR
jgi:hypothetical protein